MQSEAFRYKKSLGHSPKPSKHPNYTVFNDFNVKHVIFENNWSWLNVGGTNVGGKCNAKLLKKWKP